MNQKDLLRAARAKLNAAWDAEDAAEAKAIADRATSDASQIAYQDARSAVEAKEGAKLRADLAQAGASEDAFSKATVARTNAELDYAQIAQNRAPAGG